jgi:hypothetical protein
VTANNVPIADDDNLEDLTFDAASRKVKADVQIASSIFLNWRALVRRLLPVANGRLLEAHLGAGQQAVVDCTFAAGAVLQKVGLTAP